MQFDIISVKEKPSYRDIAVRWFTTKFGIDRTEYENSFDDMLNNNNPLPKWYLILDEDKEIIGGCGLIENDFVDRTDLSPYLCALYIEDKYRGNKLGSKLLYRVRCDAFDYGFDKIYLCTNHKGYYEKYGWYCVGEGNHPSGDISNIYEANTIIRMEPMDEFFTTRVEEYDDHMLNDVKGCREGYITMAELLPEKVKKILDIGCGTGLELDEIYRVSPDIDVTGIDMTQAMLDKISVKHPDKKINLICGNYFEVDFGEELYEAAISFQTMHHFTHEEKTEVYKKIYKSLKPKGIYMECDYMVINQSDENLFYSEFSRKRREQNIPDSVFYHCDTPCTIKNQISMLKEAGFKSADMVWRIENTTIIIAYR